MQDLLEIKPLDSDSKGREKMINSFFSLNDIHVPDKFPVFMWDWRRFLCICAASFTNKSFADVTRRRLSFRSTISLERWFIQGGDVGHRHSENPSNLTASASSTTQKQHTCNQ